jgi:hypothetical protein
VPKPDLESLEVTAGPRNIELAEAEADVDKSWVGDELPAIVVVDVVADVEGENAVVAAVECVVAQEQTDHVAPVGEDLVDTVIAQLFPRRALPHSL